MPARDAKYMETERRKIARAAYQIALEKGLARTSLRDICQRANVSTGGFYVHFRSKDEAIAASFYSIDSEAPRPNVETWQELTQYLRESLRELGTKKRKREARLFYEYMTSHMLREDSQSTHYQGLSNAFSFWRTRLEHLRTLGEVELPLGLEKSARACLHLFGGLAQTLLLEPDASFSDAIDETLEAATQLVVARPQSPDPKPKAAGNSFSKRRRSREAD